MSHSLNEDDFLRPHPSALLQSIRSFGYSFESAIADLLDNSITAGAENIYIEFDITRGAPFIRIEDDGRGMSESELVKAMRFGGEGPLRKRSNADLGRFGLGLKTAAFSQCMRLTVLSKEELGPVHIRCWDLDKIAASGDWLLLRALADDNSVKNSGSIRSSGGTIVLLEHLDRLLEEADFSVQQSQFYLKVDLLRTHLGLVFHRYLNQAKIKIWINSTGIVPIDPLLASQEFPSEELGETILSIKRSEIRIQPVILPHESKLKPEELAFVNLSRGQTQQQGIFLYRNDRIIIDGSWLNLGFKQKESQRLCRIAIDIPNTLDNEWQIDVKKSSAKVPDVIYKELRSICSKAIERSVKVYTSRGTYIPRRNRDKALTFFWQVRQLHGNRFYDINIKHPVYLAIARTMGEESPLFKNYIRMITQTLPIGQIVNDFADPGINGGSNLEITEADRRKIYDDMLGSLIRQGLSETEAREKLNTIDSFQSFL